MTIEKKKTEICRQKCIQSLRIARRGPTAASVFATGSSRDLTSPLDFTLRCLIIIIIIAIT